MKSLLAAIKLVACFSVISCCSSAQARGFSESISGTIGSGGDSMVYRYFLPADYDPEVEYPLVLLLHGAGERGTNNMSQVVRHVGNLIDKTESDYPAILLAPQLQSGSWSPFNSSDHTDEILADLINTYSVDTDRLYVTGLSLGGFGAMEYLHYYNVDNPGVMDFAAAAPLSGSFASPSAASALSEIPIWLVHGSSDGTVSVNTSRDSYRTIAGLNSSDPIPFGPSLMGGPTAIDDKLRYTEIPGLGHSGWPAMYGNDQLYDWMFLQSDRDLTGVFGDVDQDGSFTLNDLDEFILGWRSDTRGFDAYDRMRHGDLDLNGITNLDDAFIMHEAFVQNNLPGSPFAAIFDSATAVPEPTSLFILSLSCVMFSLVRVRRKY